KVVYSRGFGFIDSMNTKLATAENYFLMASITKLVCAAMVVKLVEEQKLNLDQTLSELLPDFPNKEQATKVKLRHLLSHTSGLKDYAEVIDSVFMATGINPTKADFYNFFGTNISIFDNKSLEFAKCVIDLSQYTKLVRAKILYNHIFFSN